MTKQVTIIQGHPDPNKKHFGHALADAYSNGVEEEKNEVKRINVAELDFQGPCARPGGSLIHARNADNNGIAD